MKRGGSRPPNSYGFINPRQIEEMWRDEFDWVYWEIDDGIFPITIHPDVSGVDEGWGRFSADSRTVARRSHRSYPHRGALGHVGGYSQVSGVF
jgi:peptidoglycan/xylan/chitin deacetylase (PgdA/CDA1 family)